MSDQEEFYRIKKLPPYVFEEVNSLKARLRQEGRDIIDLGMGNPDMPTPSHIVDKLTETARNPKAHRYSASRGIPGLRKAMGRYYQRRFNVALNPDTQIIATLGSKEGFANLAQAITAPGDVILSPNPAYPIHAYGFIIAGGVIQPVPALSPESYLKGLHDALQSPSNPVKAMVINYPSNPTAQIVGLDFYKEIVALAKRKEVWSCRILPIAKFILTRPARLLLFLKSTGQSILRWKLIPFPKPLQWPVGALGWRWGMNV